MIKSLSAALIAVSLLAAPAFAGATFVKTDAKVATPASTSASTQIKLTPKVADANARMHRGGRHHFNRGHRWHRGHHMHRHHHMRHHHFRYHHRRGY